MSLRAPSLVLVFVFVCLYKEIDREKDKKNCDFDAGAYIEIGIIRMKTYYQKRSRLLLTLNRGRLSLEVGVCSGGLTQAFWISFNLIIYGSTSLLLLSPN